MTTRTIPKSAKQPASRWRRLAWLIPAAVVALAVIVLLARWARDVPAVQSFLATYPGETALPESAPTGFPAWLGWQHALNAFFLVLIVRTGWQVRTVQRPKVYWTRNNTGLFRTRRQPQKISLDLWLHLTLDALWVVNGVVFAVLIFATGQWMRLVPTSWDVFPNALSVVLQYASLDWPTENGWVSYNSLQLLTYFLTVFVAAPLAAITGLRMSAVWPPSATPLTRRVNSVFPIKLARAVHFPVLLYFVLFAITHVTLVLATGALRNLNHMFATRDDAGWLGFWIFAVWLVVTIGAWFAAHPLLLRPVAALTGKVGR
jgi:thiosulfate reductase cytochrome b subunit